MITLQSIQMKTEGGSPYFSYETNKYELRITPCIAGADVALYDNDSCLIYPQICTNCDEYTIDNYKERAMSIANDLISRYESDHQEGTVAKEWLQTSNTL